MKYECFQFYYDRKIDISRVNLKILLQLSGVRCVCQETVRVIPEKRLHINPRWIDVLVLYGKTSRANFIFHGGGGRDRRAMHAQRETHEARSKVHTKSASKVQIS